MTHATGNLTGDDALHAGDDATITITVTEDGTADGAVVDISGATAITWGLETDASTPVRQITKTLGSGITVTDGPNGVFEVQIDAADTASLSAGKYKHQARVTYSGGDKETVIQGAAVIVASVLGSSE